MLFKRVLSYCIVFLVLLLILSIICLYQYRDVIASYFSNTFSSVVGIGLYLLIYVVAFALMIKAVIR